MWNPSQVWALPAVIVGVLSLKESTLIGRLFFYAIINQKGDCYVVQPYYRRTVAIC